MIIKYTIVIVLNNYINYNNVISLRYKTVVIDIKKLIEVYSDLPDNWGDLPNFKGDYINFGYWENFDFETKKLITETERIQSSIYLYDKLIDKLSICKDDVILEIGCGKGMGIVHTYLHHHFQKIIAMDINHSQIERSKHNVERLLGKVVNIEFVNARAENTNLLDNSVDKVYSIEAAQHFESIELFAKEMRRILKPSGELIFTSYFPQDDKHYAELRKLLPLIDEHLENISTTKNIEDCFLEAGFSKIIIIPIGEHVFNGYRKWIEQINKTDTFSYNYYSAYKKGYIDYYIFHIIKL